MYYPSLEEVKKLAKQGNVVPIYREIVADMETPVSAFLKIHRNDYSFLLESVEGGERLARYSFIGTEPYRVIKTSGKDKIDPLPAIKKELDWFKPVPVAGLPKFCGGAVGYLSYETVTRFEKLPSPERDPIGVPESLFMFVDTVLIFDHVTHRIKVLSHVHLDGDIEKEYQKAVKKIDELIARLSQPLPANKQARAVNPAAKQSKPTSNFSKEAYMAVVEKVKKYVTAGEVIQVVTYFFT